MFVCTLRCNRCQYETPMFVEGHSLRDRESTVICVDTQTRRPRIATVDDHPDLDDDSAIENASTRPGEIALRTQFGVEEKIEASCPKCGEPSLMKCVVGIE